MTIILRPLKTIEVMYKNVPSPTAIYYIFCFMLGRDRETHLPAAHLRERDSGELCCLLRAEAAANPGRQQAGLGIRPPEIGAHES
jgi:hypothetical protein